MVDLSNFIQVLMGTGFYSVFIPFFLIFVVIFIALRPVGMFTKLQRVAIGSIFAFMVIIMHVMELFPPCYNVVEIINASLPQIGIAAAVIILIMTAFALMNVTEVVSRAFYPWLYFAVFLYVIITVLTFNSNACGAIFPMDSRYRFFVPGVFLIVGLIKLVFSRNNTATP